MAVVAEDDGLRAAVQGSGTESGDDDRGQRDGRVVVETGSQGAGRRSARVSAVPSVRRGSAGGASGNSGASGSVAGAIGEAHQPADAGAELPSRRRASTGRNGGGGVPEAGGTSVIRSYCFPR